MKSNYNYYQARNTSFILIHTICFLSFTLSYTFSHAHNFILSLMRTILSSHSHNFILSDIHTILSFHSHNFIFSWTHFFHAHNNAQHFAVIIQNVIYFLNNIFTTYKGNTFPVTPCHRLPQTKRKFTDDGMYRYATSVI